MEKFFSFAANIVFKPTCIAYVSAVNMELNFRSDAYSVRSQVEAAASIPISFWSRLGICDSILFIYSQ